MTAPPSQAAAAAADVLVLDDAAYGELPDAAGLDLGEYVEADFHLSRYEQPQYACSRTAAAAAPECLVAALLKQQN
jgi:hypothetical protein